MEKYGKITAPGALLFERLLTGSVEKVWRYLTDSELRGKWLAKGQMELFEGGNVTLEFLHSELGPAGEEVPQKYKSMEHGHTLTGKILQCNPPHVLSFTWGGESEVTFNLSESEIPGKVLLSLTHRKLGENKDNTISVLSGWHTHLDMLMARLQEHFHEGFWSRHTEMEGVYRDRLDDLNA
jgi:uncharacterized protein YndB with AHSA1/START domain